jgi:hypothetical protein
MVVAMKARPTCKQVVREQADAGVVVRQLLFRQYIFSINNWGISARIKPSETVALALSLEAGWCP